jgi:hypothetical protein
MLQLAAAFLPKLGSCFARSAVGDDLHLRQMFFPRRIRTPAESRIRSAPMAPKSDRANIGKDV